MKTPHNTIKCGLSAKQPNFNAKHGSKVSNLLTVRAERVSRIDGKQFNSYAKCLQAQCKISPYHKTFTFYDSSLKFLVRQFSFWYCIIIVANKLSGIGTASSGIDPTGFGLYPTSIPSGVIVPKCRKCPKKVEEDNLEQDGIDTVHQTGGSKRGGGI